MWVVLNSECVNGRRICEISSQLTSKELPEECMYTRNILRYKVKCAYRERK